MTTNVKASTNVEAPRFEALTPLPGSIPLDTAFSIAAPLDRVWPLLSDPSLVAACIPGAAMSSMREDGSYVGQIRFKFGPTVAVFNGEARILYDDAGHRCAIDARGVDQKGASRAIGRFNLSAAGTDRTEAELRGGFMVSGPLETFARAGGAHVAKALLEEFSLNIARMVEQRTGDGAIQAQVPSVTSAEESTAPIGVAGLLWRAFRQWLRGLRGRRD